MDIFREFDDGDGRSDDEIEMKSERVQNEDREAEARCGAEMSSTRGRSRPKKLRPKKFAPQVGG